MEDRPILSLAKEEDFLKKNVEISAFKLFAQATSASVSDLSFI